MTRLARLLAGAVAALVAGPGLAQSFIADNELRRQLNDINRHIMEVRRMADNVAGNHARLGDDLASIKRLASEVRAGIRATSRAAAGREVDLQDIEATREEDQGLMVHHLALGIDRLADQVDVNDARDYARALTTYDSLGQVEEARTLLEGIIARGDRSPLVPAARHWLGRIQYEQGEFSTARDTLTETLALHPGDHNEPETLHLLAEIAVLTGDTGVAALQDRLLRLHPHSLAASRLRAIEGAGR